MQVILGFACEIDGYDQIFGAHRPRATRSTLAIRSVNPSDLRFW